MLLAATCLFGLERQLGEEIDALGLKSVGKVSLYKRKECVEKNIPTDQAVDKLIALIKSNGDWKE